jgi:hypothetical protein
MSGPHVLAANYEVHYPFLHDDVKFLIDNCLTLSNSFMGMYSYAKDFLRINETRKNVYDLSQFYYTHVPENHDLKRTYVMAIFFALEAVEPSSSDEMIDFIKLFKF